MSYPRFDADAVVRTRLARGITRAELAEAAQITRQALFNIEQRGATPKPATAKALAEALELDPSDLWLVAA